MPDRPPTLATERLVLRPHRPDDLDAVHALWSDPAVLRHLGAAPASRSEAWQRLLRYAGLWPLCGYGYWAVERGDTGGYVGDIGLADFHRPITPSLAAPEAGWALVPSVWGRGYASEALTAVLAWHDRAAPDASTCCVIEPANSASIRVAEKCGYDEQGERRLGTTTVLLFERGARGRRTADGGAVDPRPHPPVEGR